MKQKKSGSGGKLNRSEIVQARLNPKLHFAAELVARLESRTLSSLIESVLDDYLRKYKTEISFDESEKDKFLNELIDEIWSTDPIIRFANIALLFPNHLTTKEQLVWAFVDDTPYFWAHYKVVVKNSSGKVLREDWESYFNIKGLVINNLHEYWEQIQTEEGRASVNIPNQRGKEIELPDDVDGVIYEEYDFSKPLKNDVMAERDRYSIWLKHVPSLIKKEFETIKTPAGEMVEMKIIYPSPEEQREMVERIYQERQLCQSSSAK